MSRHGKGGKGVFNERICIKEMVNSAYRWGMGRTAPINGRVFLAGPTKAASVISLLISEALCVM